MNHTPHAAPSAASPPAASALDTRAVGGVSGSEHGDNYSAALKAEAKRVIRCWQRYDHEQRALMASVNLKYRSPNGEFYYVHPDVPGRAFPKRRHAALAAMECK